MRATSLLLLGAMSLLVGCHKKEVPASPTATQSQGDSSGETAKPMAPPPPSITSHAENKIGQGVAGTVDDRLTAALRGFVQKKGRMPQSFYEFSSTSFDSTPRPPEGMKWVIDAGDTTVKVVPK
jgi:hypothetical protein